MIPSDLALQMAARCWCDDETQSIEMDTRLATAFAKRLDLFMHVASVAQGVLTAMNVGDVERESPLHKDLRKTMIEHRARLAEVDPTIDSKKESK